MATKPGDVLTMRVKYIRELGEPGDNDSFATYIVISGEPKKRIRVTTLNQLAQLRAAHKLPDDVSDVDFLMGDPQMQGLLRAVNGHFEFALCQMGVKKDGVQRIEFPANAFEGGDVKASTQ